MDNIIISNLFVGLFIGVLFSGFNFICRLRYVKSFQDKNAKIYKESLFFIIGFWLLFILTKLLDSKIDFFYRELDYEIAFHLEIFINNFLKPLHFGLIVLLVVNGFEMIKKFRAKPLDIKKEAGDMIDSEKDYLNQAIKKTSSKTKILFTIASFLTVPLLAIFFYPKDLDPSYGGRNYFAEVNCSCFGFKNDEKGKCYGLTFCKQKDLMLFTDDTLPVNNEPINTNEQININEQSNINEQVNLNEPINTPIETPSFEARLSNTGPTVSLRFDSPSANSGLYLSGSPEFKSQEECLYGGCLAFDGVKDYAFFEIDSLRTYSVSLWVKILSHDNTERQIFSTDYDMVGLTVYNNSTFLFFDGAVLQSQTRAENNRFYHVIIVHDGYNKYLYVDGKLESQELSSGGGILKGHAYLGVLRKGNFYRHFNGVIDEFLLYDYPLSSPEVQSIYESRGSMY